MRNTAEENALVNVLIDFAPTSAWEILVLQHGRFEVGGLFGSMGACAAFGDQKEEIRPSQALDAAIDALYAAYDAAGQPFHQFELEVQNASNEFRYRFDFGRLPATKENAKQRVAMNDRFSRFAAARGKPSAAPAAPLSRLETSSDDLPERVIQLLAQHTKKAAGATERTRLVEDMKLNGAELVELGMSIRGEFDVQLPEPNYPAAMEAFNEWMDAPVGVGDVGAMRTVGDIVAYVRERI